MMLFIRCFNPAVQTRAKVRLIILMALLCCLLFKLKKVVLNVQ